MEEIRTMLEKVAAGEMTVEDAVLELKKEPFTAAGFDDLGFAKLDTHRKLRQGAAEVIYGAGKTAEQIAGIVEAMKKRGQQVILITRLDKEKAERTASLLGTPLSETPSNGAPLSETLLHGPQNEVFRYFSDAQIGLCGEFPKKDGVGTIVVATGGTSGVVYGVTDVPKADPQSRVNTFLHVTDSPEPRMGVLLCINGTGIMNSWAHKNVAPELSYPEMNELAATAPVGADGLFVLPFGNGAERVLANRSVGAKLAGIDLVRHGKAHILRAVQEGIAFSFRYGIDIMKDLGLHPNVIRAGKANMFLSPLFRSTLATLGGARIELFDTDGSLGAARGAALGAGIYRSADEAFSTLERLDVIEPVREWKEPLDEAYARWKKEVELALANNG